MLRSDVRDNDLAVYHHSSDILVIAESNIVDNARGVLIDADEIDRGSAIRASNLYGNGSLVTTTESGTAKDWRAQVWARHAVGNLDLSSNFWGAVLPAYALGE